MRCNKFGCHGKYQCKNEARPGLKSCTNCASASKKSRKERIEGGLCANPYCKGIPAEDFVLCEKCRAVQNRATIRYVANKKKIIYDHYGRICVCCGETEPKFLTLDHINGGGKLDRGTSATHNWYFKLAKRIQAGNAPKDLRILCYNCNCGRSRNDGICPHRVTKNE